jgi:hypothetical protein
MRKLILISLMILCFAISANLALADNETGGLFIKELDVSVDSNTDSDLDNDTTINEKASPGDTIEFTIELENTFDRDENCDEDNDDDKNECNIEDIKIEITIVEIDDGDDLEEDSGDKFEISESDTKTKTISLELPKRLESGSYDIIIMVEGENTGNSSDYLTEWELKLDVEKKKHDIQITKYDLIPERIECGALSTTIDIELMNYGDKIEDEVVIEILNSDLNIKETASNIKMDKDYDKDAKYEKSIQINIEEDFSVGGTYPLTINAYFDNDKLDDQKTIDLIIDECIVEVVEEPVIEEVIEEETVPVLYEEETVVEEKTINLSDLIIDNINFNDQESYFGLIAGLISLVGIFIIIILIILIKKS